MKFCVFVENKFCNECGECMKCDLDPNKICDNCCKCIEDSSADYLGIEVDGLYLEEDEL